MSSSSEVTQEISRNGHAGGHGGAAAVESPAHVQGTAQAPAKKRGSKVFFLLPLSIIIVLGIAFYLHGLGVESTDDAFIEGHVSQISPRVSGHIQKVHVDDNQVVKEGEVLVELDPADYQIRLSQAQAALAAVEAKVEAARSGVALTSGTTSADVEQATSGLAEARSALESAKAQVATAQSMKRQAEAQLTAEEATASEERANVRAAEADAGQAQSDLKRYRKLMGDGAISQQQLDQANTADRNATAKLDSARQKAASEEARIAASRAAVQTASQGLVQAETLVTQAQARIGSASGKLRGANTAPHQVAVSKSQLKALDAELAQARAEVDQARLNLQYTRITAPVAGRVTRKSAEQGNYVQTGQAIMALVPANVWVVANFKETQLTHMKPGQQAWIKVDAYPGVEFTGKVDSIQAGTGARFSLLPPENATGNYVKVVQRVPVKIVLDQKPGDEHVLAPGMSVEPKVAVK